MVAVLARLGSSFESRLSSYFHSCRNRGRERSSFITCAENRTSSKREWRQNSAQSAQPPTHNRRLTQRSSFSSRQDNIRTVSVSSSQPQEFSELKTNHDSTTKKTHPSTGQGHPQVQKVIASGDSRRIAKASVRDQYRRALAFPVLIQQALLQRDFAGLMKTLLSSSNDLEFIKRIPANTFTEILAVIRPHRAMAWIKSPYHSLSPEAVEKLHIPPVYDLIRNHLCQVLEILAKRKDAGGSLNVSDYALILGIARWAGLKDVAASFWKSMLADQITPNLKCYNNYMGAIVSNLYFRADVKHKHCVTPFNTEARQQKQLGQSFEAYRVGDYGMKEAVMSIYKEMQENHIPGNEETYRLLIIGVARGGDLDTVKKILKQVWKVDADALAEGREDDFSTLQGRLTQTSPLYPKYALLYTVVHAFGINNDIPAALRILDYVSRLFNMKVRLNVWRELFNWTFVSSLPRQKSRRESASLPKQSVQRLWDTMRNEPYNAKPSIDMYDKLIKSLFLRQRTKDMWFYMNEALPLYRQTRMTTETAYERLNGVTEEKGPSFRASSSTGSFDKDYLRNDIVQKHALLMVKRWVRLFLGSMRSWRKVDKDLFWSTQQVPKFIHEWRDFMPSEVWYSIPSGSVKIQFRTAKQKLDSQIEGYTKSREKAKVLSSKRYELPWPIEGVRTRRMQRASINSAKAKNLVGGQNTDESADSAES